MAISSSAEQLSRRDFALRAVASGALLAMPGALIACGSDEEETADTGALRGSITYIKGPYSEDDPKIQAAFAKEFMKTHPGVRVKATFYDWAVEEAQLTAALSRTPPPDLLMLDAATFPKFAALGALSDLGERIAAPDYKTEYDSIDPKYWDAATINDKTYGVPYDAGAMAHFVNLDLLEAAGASDWQSSYEAMRDAARATRNGKVFGFTLKTSFKDFAFQSWIPYVRDNGADLLTEDRGSANLYTGADSGAAAAWGLLRAIMLDDGSSPPPGAYDKEGLRALFVAGRSAIHHDQTDLVGVLADEQPEFRWDVVLAPPGPAGQSTLTMTSFHAIAAKSENQELAWAYLRARAAPDASLEYYNQLGGTAFPLSKDALARVLPDLSGFENVKKTIVPAAQPYPVTPKLFDTLRAANNEFELCVSGKKNVEDAAKDAHDAVNEVLQA